MKKLLIAIGILAVIAIGIYIYLHNTKLKDFEPQIKEKLNDLIMKASNGLYHLDIERLETDVVSSKITLINAHLRADTLVYAKLEQAKIAPDDVFDITISQLMIDDIVPADFLLDKAVILGKLFINNPVITVSHKKQAYNQPGKDSSKTVFEKIKNDISSIKVDTLILQNVNFVYTNKDRKNKQTRLANVKLFFSDILVDSTSQFDQQRFLFSRNCLISLQDYTLKTSDSLYRFKIGALEIETASNSMQIKNLQFVPRVAAPAFYKAVKHQQDRFEITMGEVNFNQVNWWAILAEESLLVGRSSIGNGKLQIFNDKSQPVDERSKVGKYPHQLLMKLPFQLRIDTMAIRNIDLSYTELNPKSNEAGTLYFDNIQGLITNITNDPLRIKSNHFTRITAKATFMKQTPLTAGFSFDLNKHKEGQFTINASLGVIKADAINKITIPLGMLKVNSVNIKSLDASVSGDNYQGSATVKIIYDDLNITALKATEDTLKKRGLLSFIANTFVIKKENPYGKQPVRVEKGSFERNTQRSFFNLVWKTIFTGAGKTVGYKVKK